MSKPKVLVIVRGGIAYVYSDAPVDVVMADYDLDGCTEEELAEYPKDKNGNRVNAYRDGDVDPELVEEYFRILEPGLDEKEVLERGYF